jgi:hypothetical protein
MFFGILLLGIICVLWLLLIAGWIWKIFLGIGGWIGITYVLSSYLPESKNVCLTISGMSVSWATTIASVVLFMSMLHTKGN